MTMKLLKKKNCSGCGACYDVCPMQAIKMKRDYEGFLYPHIAKNLCIECGKCQTVCPMEDMKCVISDNQYLGAKTIWDNERTTSSSGGIFPILAQYILKKDGIVYGAAFQKNFVLKHQGIEDEEGLQLLKETKYVQSDMRGIYKEICREIEKGRTVLFSGTPCQCEALRKFLGIIPENLLLVSLVCYGVPSPRIWEKYVHTLEKEHQGKLKRFSFRDKRDGDCGHTVSYSIENQEYISKLNDNPYLKLYFRNYIIRPACFQCPFTTVHREFDFTIGDFWGIERVNPDFEDGMGTSIVIAHSEKAKHIFEILSKEMKYFLCEKPQIMQPRLCEPTARPQKKKLFMLLYHFLPFKIVCKLLH